MARYYAANGPIKTKNNSPLVREKESEPCGLPFGSHSVVLDAAMRSSMNSVKVNDLYKGVNQEMQDDARNLRSMVKPHNW